VEGVVGKWEEEESFGAWKWGSEDVVFRVEKHKVEDKAMPYSHYILPSSSFSLISYQAPFVSC